MFQLTGIAQKIRNQNMEDLGEFAQEYTDKERTRLVLINVAIAALVFFVGEHWISPWYKWFAATAHCHYILGFSGTKILFYGIFVGLPCLAMLVFVNFAWVGYKILRDGQTPPKKSKVFKKTKIIRGKLAVVKGIFAILVPVAFIPFGVWGYFQAQEITTRINMSKFDYSICKANFLFSTDVSRQLPRAR